MTDSFVKRIGSPAVVFDCIGDHYTIIYVLCPGTDGAAAFSEHGDYLERYDVCHSEYTPSVD